VAQHVGSDPLQRGGGEWRIVPYINKCTHVSTDSPGGVTFSVAVTKLLLSCVIVLFCVEVHMHDRRHCE